MEMRGALYNHQKKRKGGGGEVEKDSKRLNLFLELTLCIRVCVQGEK